MKPRELHRIAGIALLLPFVAWAATALFFLFRPAYEHAYAPLEATQYPLEQALTLEPRPEWLELRYFRSILGPHLLVRDARGWQQLDPETLQPRPYPEDVSLRALLTDAMQSKPRRYGSLAAMDEGRISTDTGVEITLDWGSLSFTQSGRDTRWINRMYSIHYLEWTGIRVLDRVLGLFGLGLLLYMAWSGARLAFGWGRAGRPQRLQQASVKGARL